MYLHRDVDVMHYINIYTLKTPYLGFIPPFNRTLNHIESCYENATFRSETFFRTVDLPGHFIFVFGPKYLILHCRNLNS